MADDDGDPTSIPTTTNEDRVKLNVGGKIFETTVSTVQSGGPDSVLAALSNRPVHERDPIFIDRDPEIFSVLLSFLRSNHFPSTACQFSKQELADEAVYYGIESRIRSAMSPPPLIGIDASRVATIQPMSDGFPSTFTAAEDDGSVLIAHGGQISLYDWSLSHAGTVRTHLNELTSICRVWHEVAAVGSLSTAGLHFYDLAGGRHIGSSHWTDSSDPRIYKARVFAVADSPSSVFASFNCPHRENCVLVIDKSTFGTSSTLGRQSGNSSKTIVPQKLTWLPEKQLLVGSAITCGAFGYSGYMRMWDFRSGELVWETNEPGSERSSRYGDSFADVSADPEESKLFKVCSKSGDLAIADVRKLSKDPWIYLKDKNPNMRNPAESGNMVMHCFRKQVFVGRDGELEVWSRLENRESCEVNDEGLYRRNYVDKEEDSKRGVIRKIEGGGDRLFVARDDLDGVEVWETSNLSGAESLF